MGHAAERPTPSFAGSPLACMTPYTWGVSMCCVPTTVLLCRNPPDCAVRRRAQTLSGGGVGHAAPYGLCSIELTESSFCLEPAQIWYSAVTNTDAKPTARPTTLPTATCRRRQQGRFEINWSWWH